MSRFSTASSGLLHRHPIVSGWPGQILSHFEGGHTSTFLKPREAGTHNAVMSRAGTGHTACSLPTAHVGQALGGGQALPRPASRHRGRGLLMLRSLAAQGQVCALIRLFCSAREGAGRQSAGSLERRAGFKAASFSYWGDSAGTSSRDCSTVEGSQGADHAVRMVRTAEPDPGCWAPEKGRGPASHSWQALARR